MASNTPNLDLLKKDPIVDANDTFNIETMLNENWDKIDDSIGDNTIDDTLSPSTDTGLSVKVLLSWLANMVKSITGKASWRIKPTKNLEELNTALTTHKAENIHLKEVHGLRIEEGIFTPTIIDGTNNQPTSYLKQAGFFTRIGNTVLFHIIVHIGTKGAALSGALLIGGLPYISKNATNRYSTPSIGYADKVNIGSGKTLTAFLAPNKSAFNIGIAPNDGGNQGNVTASMIGDGTYIMISGQYQI